MTELELLLQEYLLSSGALLNEQGEVLVRVGNFSPWAESLLGPIALLLWDGAVRPAMTGQGREFALLQKVAPGWALVFGQDRAQGTEHILFARQVGQALQDRFGPA
ncbi:MAG: hypothetical protein U0931_05700 [Vulcanimicrobiota bacterium]